MRKRKPVVSFPKSYILPIIVELLGAEICFNTSSVRHMIPLVFTPRTARGSAKTEKTP